MSEVWTLDQEQQYSITYGSITRYYTGSITASDVISFAKEAGLTSFVVKTQSGRTLSQDDFPVQENLIIERFVKVG